MNGLEWLCHGPKYWTDKEHWLSLTSLTDGAAVVGFIGGVDAVRGRAVWNAAVYLPVGLTATSLTSRQLEHTQNLNFIHSTKKRPWQRCHEECGKMFTPHARVSRVQQTHTRTAALPHSITGLVGSICLIRHQLHKTLPLLNPYWAHVSKEAVCYHDDATAQR